MRAFPYTEIAVGLVLYFWGSVIWAVVEFAATDANAHARFGFALGCVLFNAICFAIFFIRCAVVHISTPSAEPAQPSVRDDACDGGTIPLFVVDIEDELQISVANSDTPDRRGVAVTIVQNP